jgi:pSer/pThr/pTyr-binding forkhead associated (FHA) protein
VDILLNVRSKTDNSVRESRLPVNGRVFVGRGTDCVVFLDGQSISRQHLGVDAGDAGVFVTDLSSNGTWLNGKRLSQNGRFKIEEDDLIELPGYELRIRTPGGLQGASPASSREDPSPAPAPVFASGSLTWLEKFVIFVALLSVVLVLVYLTS